ncbi:hypothetical protein, partial [Cupriavidus sp. UYPR2.512]|uniref:hypothetical protein n=1 Tax=Cupriavidus sp. UYPR2.512 TaxID=1080187 RepID=UPI001E2BA4AA
VMSFNHLEGGGHKIPPFFGTGQPAVVKPTSGELSAFELDPLSWGHRTFGVRSGAPALKTV